MNELVDYLISMQGKKVAFKVPDKERKIFLDNKKPPSIFELAAKPGVAAYVMPDDRAKDHYSMEDLFGPVTKKNSGRGFVLMLGAKNSDRNYIITGPLEDGAVVPLYHKRDRDRTSLVFPTFTRTVRTFNPNRPIDDVFNYKSGYNYHKFEPDMVVKDKSLSIWQVTPTRMLRVISDEGLGTFTDWVDDNIMWGSIMCVRYGLTGNTYSEVVDRTITPDEWPQLYLTTESVIVRMKEGREPYRNLWETYSVNSVNKVEALPQRATAETLFNIRMPQFKNIYKAECYLSMWHVARMTEPPTAGRKTKTVVNEEKPIFFDEETGWIHYYVPDAGVRMENEDDFVGQLDAYLKEVFAR